LIVSRRHGLWLVLVAFGLLTSACASKEKARRTEVQKLQARAAYDRALSYINDKQPAPAMAALQEAININPSSALYRDTLGVVLLELGRPDMALEHFKKAVELEPLYADAHFHMGTALAESRRWDEAVTSYRRALELPTLTIPESANQNLGLALYHLKRYREAEQTLRFAISLDPKMQSAYYNLGLVFIAENRKDEAKAAFRQARQLGPDSPVGQAAQDRLKALGEGG
jgi:Tfp pilus assembly protein PilF